MQNRSRGRAPLAISRVLASLPSSTSPPVTAGVGRRSGLPLRHSLSCASAVRLGDSAHLIARQRCRKDAKLRVYIIFPESPGKSRDLSFDVAASREPGATAEITPVGEIEGAIGHYRFTPGAICRLMIEDYDQATGKNVKAAAAA